MTANENRSKLVAPCGLDCGICELHQCRDNQQLKQFLISKGIPEDVLPCNGCRSVEGKCPVIGERCETYSCVKDKEVAFCSQCTDFPCMKLAPAADRAQTLPHNMKTFNLCIIESMGIDELISRSREVKTTYFKGKMEIGKGPILETE